MRLAFAVRRPALVARSAGRATTSPDLFLRRACCRAPSWLSRRSRGSRPPRKRSSRKSSSPARASRARISKPPARSSRSRPRRSSTASGTAETTLNRYPQFVPSYTGTSNNAGNLNSYSDGKASLNLRGLGENRTLTLVDGRRLMPVNGNGETDLNVIPPALIESVEIVTGGASAVYGSDAIAGVVNLRLRHKFDGVEFGGRWGQTGHGDGDESDLSLMAGTNSPTAADRCSATSVAAIVPRSISLRAIFHEPLLRRPRQRHCGSRSCLRRLRFKLYRGRGGVSR